MLPGKAAWTYGAASVAVKICLYHPGLGVLRHKIPLVFFQIAYHFGAERQLKIAAFVYCHGFRPYLFDVGSGNAGCRYGQGEGGPGRWKSLQTRIAAACPPGGFRMVFYRPSSGGLKMT